MVVGIIVGGAIVGGGRHPAPGGRPVLVDPRHRPGAAGGASPGASTAVVADLCGWHDGDAVEGAGLFSGGGARGFAVRITIFLFLLCH